jgi:ParB family chromosome partitioning protein
MHTTGLGRGLDALIRDNTAPKNAGGIENVPVANISPNPKQPRKHFDQASLEELAESLKSQGLLQPLLLRPLDPTRPGKYEIVAGERRWRACKLAGLKEVPAMIRAFSEQDTIVAALIENLQREDLNPMEEALGLHGLKEEFGLSQEELARKIGKSRSAIANSLRLLSLPPDVQKVVSEGGISAGHARALLSITDARAQEALLRLILDHGLTVRETEGQAAIWKESGSFALQGEGLAAAPPSEEATPAPEGTPPEAERPEGAKRPQSAILLQAQNAIRELFQVTVKVTGKEDKGKISFSYNSREELERLLERFTTAALEGADHLPLAGAAHPPLEGHKHKEMRGQSHQALSGAKHQALQGASNQALEGARNQALPGNAAAAIGGQARQALESGALAERAAAEK